MVYVWIIMPSFTNFAYGSKSVNSFESGRETFPKQTNVNVKQPDKCDKSFNDRFFTVINPALAKIDTISDLYCTILPFQNKLVRIIDLILSFYRFNNIISLLQYEYCILFITTTLSLYYLKQVFKLPKTYCSYRLC